MEIESNSSITRFDNRPLGPTKAIQPSAVRQLIFSAPSLFDMQASFAHACWLDQR
ncbi:hypothetical protein BSIN_2932 [Burkholderia singularis]|uniref:Uncharacterized protein n=1 Tax=Burkholderia singularis TaxID=1503053 RepID=A0A238H358_9BURK|nr:hypothetical protein BSIN_2932 [Burkholderia singularis]